MAFNALQDACAAKDCVSFNDLPIGEYPIRNFSLTDTMYGTTLKVEFADKYVFLPRRFAANQTNDTVAELNNPPKILVYNGKDPRRNNR